MNSTATISTLTLTSAATIRDIVLTFLPIALKTRWTQTQWHRQRWKIGNKNFRKFSQTFKNTKMIFPNFIFTKFWFSRPFYAIFAIFSSFFDIFPHFSKFLAIFSPFLQLWWQWDMSWDEFNAICPSFAHNEDAFNVIHDFAMGATGTV